MDREYLREMHPEVVILEPPDLDRAILGLVDLGDREVLLYSRTKLILCFEEQGMTLAEAVEYFDFNVAGAHMGSHTPIYLTMEWGD